jgi:tetratricopeptide (TPR) repeat protein
VADAPEHVDAWGNLGYLLQLSGKYEEAARCYREVVTYRTQDWEAYRRMGDCWWGLGNRRKAFESYKQLKGSPLAGTTPIRQRIRTTEPLGGRLLSEGWALNRLFLKRLFEKGFAKRYTRELLNARKALPAIESSGFSAYLNYLIDHYLQERFDRFPITPCDFCGGTRFTPTFFFLGQKSVRCEGCGLEFVERKPPDSMDVLVDWYNQDSSIEFMEKDWHNDRILKDRISRLRKVHEEAGRPFPGAGARVFEIGCAEGHLLKYLQDQGAAAEGIETGMKLVEYCRERFDLKVTRSTVREWNAEQRAVDIVLAYHGLEHLEQPSELFRKAHEALKPGGLFLEVPTPTCRSAGSSTDGTFHGTAI